MKDLAAVYPFLRAVSVALLLLTCVALLPNAQAQAAGITSIANVQYSSQAVLQNGVAKVAVTFTVYYNYYYNPQGYLIFAIYTAGTTTIAKGSAAASPDPCQSLTGTNYADSAVCAVIPATTSGTDSASFTLTFNSAQQYSLTIVSFIWDTRNLQSGNQVNGSTNTASLTISVTGQTVSTSSTTTSSTVTSTAISSPSTSTSTSLTTTAATGTASSSSMSTSTSSEPSTSNYTDPIIVIALIVAVAAAIIFVASRRRTARPISTRMKENGERTAKPSGSFCTNCGARIPEGNAFCSQCGKEQK